MSDSSTNNSGSAIPGGGSSQSPSTSPIPPSAPSYGFPGNPGEGGNVPAPPYPFYPYPAPPPYPPYPYPPYPPNVAMPPVLPPPYYFLPPAQRRSHRALWISLGAALVGVVLICGVCSYLTVASFQTFTSGNISGDQVPATLQPVVEAANFCSYEINSAFHEAYAQLSAHLQTQITETQFVSDNQGRDAVKGSLIGCSAALSPGSPPSSSSSMVLELNIWSGSITGNAPPVNQSGTMTVVQEGSGWKVDAIDSSLQLL
jgi:hypothetical protein